MNKVILATLLLVSPLLVSCGSIAKPRSPSVSVTSGAKVYVVKHENSSRDIDTYLRNGFAKRGYLVT